MELMSKAVVVVVSLAVIIVGRLVALILASRRRYVKVKKLMDSQGVVGPPPSSWIAGNTVHSSTAVVEDMEEIDHNVVPRIWPWHVKCLNDYKCTKYIDWGLYMQPLFNVADPLLSYEMQTRMLERPASFKKIIDSVFGKGIFNADVKVWTGRRAQLNPTFHSEKIKMMVETMVHCVDVMIEDWERKITGSGGGPTEIEVHDALVEVTADIIGETAFGTKGAVNKKCVHILNDLQDLVMLQAPFVVLVPGFTYLPTEGNRKTWKLTKELYDIVSEVIKSRLKEAESSVDGSVYGHDMLGALLSVAADKKKLDISYLVDECKNFYLAGHETSAHLLTWAMMLLALHPEWQDRGREEVRSLQGRHTTDLNKLKIVGMIMSEALRLYPIAPQIVRETTEDTTFSNGKLFLPKGTIVLIDALSIHHNKQLWGEDASEFRPERFANALEGGQGKYSPFGIGPRMCLGRAYALVEVKLIMAMLLDKFEWKMSPKYRHAPMMRFTVYPRHGMPLVVSRATS